MTLSPRRTLQNVIQTQICELCQLNIPTTPFPAEGFPPDTTSSTRPKAQAWSQFNRHALLIIYHYYVIVIAPSILLQFFYDIILD